MVRAQPKPTAPRGGAVNMWLPGPLKESLTRLKTKHGLSWSQLLEMLLEKAGEKKP